LGRLLLKSAAKMMHRPTAAVFCLFLMLGACLGFTPTSSFAPGALRAPSKTVSRPTSSRHASALSPSMSMADALEGAVYVVSAAGVANVPFVDEITGDPQGFTSPVNHFASVIGLWVLFSLPVWSAAYKKAGGRSIDWSGVSQVTFDAPGIGAFPRYTPAYDGPSFTEGLTYFFSFFWKPPILIAWKPRTDLDLATMDPTRETVVSSLYKGFGGALDKDAYYDEQDQLLILSDIVTFAETDLGRRREKIAEENGWYQGNPSFGKSLIEYSEETKKGVRDFGTVTISAAELAALRADAAKAKQAPSTPSTPRQAPKAAPPSAAAKAKAAALGGPAGLGMGTMAIPKVMGKIPFFGKTQRATK